MFACRTRSQVQRWYFYIQLIRCNGRIRIRCSLKGCQNESVVGRRATDPHGGNELQTLWQLFWTLKARHHDHITGCYIRPYCKKFGKVRNDRKRTLSPTNHGNQTKFCRDAHTIPVDAEFEMNGDNFMQTVFFHNLKGLDSHFIMTYIDWNFSPCDIPVIPKYQRSIFRFKSVISDS